MISKFKLPDTSKSTQTKEAISRTLQIANNYAGELAIEVLALDKIELDPENAREMALTLEDAMNGISKADPNYERKNEDWKSLESLANTIKNDQLINPIFVYRFGNKCRLIAGERRTLASAIAGKKEIIARIASQRPVGTRLKVLQWIENHERSELSVFERIQSLESILEEYFKENKEAYNKDQITAKLLGDLTGMSLTQARRYLLVLQAGPKIRQAITEGKLENIKLIELICSAKNMEQHNELLSEAINGKTFEYIAQLKKQFETAQRIKKETRGRKKAYVSLGNVKPNIVMYIVNALTTSNILKPETIKQLNSITHNIKWENSEVVSKAFKKIVSLLEMESFN